MVRTVRTLCRWLATTAEPVEPEFYVGFMDRATARWGCRFNRTLPLDHPDAVVSAAPIRIPLRAQLQRHPERAVPEEAQAILAAGLVAHVGFVERGQPYVIPMAYHYDPTTPGGAPLFFPGCAEAGLASGFAPLSTVKLQ